jgi:lipid-A-disaccharide synthase-like uncharacterized protein
MNIGSITLAAVTWIGERHRFLGLDWNYLVILGFIGQLVFTMRFVIQWIVSEKKKESVIPVVFWHLSIAGGVILSVYFLFRREPVGLIGNLFGSIVYLRNLRLIHRVKQRSESSLISHDRLTDAQHK